MGTPWLNLDLSLPRVLAPLKEEAKNSEPRVRSEEKDDNEGLGDRVLMGSRTGLCGPQR